MLSDIKPHDRFSLFFFLFPLSNVFKLSPEQTSLFMALRIGIILSTLIYDTKRFNNPKLYLMMMFTVIYDICISLSNDASYLVRIVNVVLWFIVIYCMQSQIDSENISSVSIALVNGTILSSVVGMNLDWIPNMKDAVNDVQEYVSYDHTVSRFTGLFNDPNIFTLLICACLWLCYLEYMSGNMNVSEFTIRSILISFFGAITYSKSCMIILLVFWSYVFLSRNKIKMFSKIFLGISFAIALIYFFGINNEWLDIMLMRFGAGKRDLSRVTTGRSDIWKAYLEYMYVSGSWVWGNGVKPLLPMGMGAHNAILEVMYNLGFVGTFIMYRNFKLVYAQTPSCNKSDSIDLNGLMFLLFIFLIMFFLDFIMQEAFYYILSLAFVYMKCNKKSDKEVCYNFDTSI